MNFLKREPAEIWDRIFLYFFTKFSQNKPFPEHGPPKIKYIFGYIINKIYDEFYTWYDLWLELFWVRNKCQYFNE